MTSSKPDAVASGNLPQHETCRKGQGHVSIFNVSNYSEVWLVAFQAGEFRLVKVWYSNTNEYPSSPLDA